MKTIEERVASLETQAAAAAAAGVAGFGPSAPVGGDTGPLYPSEPVNGSGSVLPWNPQPGEAGVLVFRGPTDYNLVPDPNPDGSPFTGSREISISVVAPQFSSVSAKLDADPAELAGTIGYAKFAVWFAEGKPRVLHLVPSGNDRADGGCGKVQIVGGV